MNKFEKYFSAINFLEGLSNLPLRGDYMIDSKHADLYLKRMRYFLNLLGNPDKKMKFIHIAGTSGKGTVTNMVHEILHASGKKAGSFTSPFVTTSIEKIKVGDKYIAPDELADIVSEIKPAINKAYLDCPFGRPSYFEIFFAIALIYFKNKKCDFVVLEVGLGGRYDATNVIEKPLITAITNIDYDHTEILGKTLKKIGTDKAGIIKSGSVFFTTERRSALLQIFSEICQEKRVQFNQVTSSGAGYQEENKALAGAITRHIGVSDAHITVGIQNARLMCRFEIIQNENGKPLVILDGAHNRSKIKTTIDNLQKINFKKLYLIVGISNNKDHISILKQLIPYADQIFFTRFQIKDRKCAHPKELLAKSRKYFKKGAKTEICLDSESALLRAHSKASAKDVILVAGSFFLAGELRKKWISEEWVLENRRAFM